MTDTSQGIAGAQILRLALLAQDDSLGSTTDKLQKTAGFPAVLPYIVPFTL